MVYNIIGYNDSTILTKNLCLVSFSWTFSASLSCSLLFTFIRLIISMIYVKIKNIGANSIYLLLIYLSIYRSTDFQSIIILQSRSARPSDTDSSDFLFRTIDFKHGMTISEPFRYNQESVTIL